MRHKYFRVMFPRQAASQDEIVCRTLTRARELAKDHSQTGLRMWVGTTDGHHDETWFHGVRTHHYTRARRLVIDHEVEFACLQRMLGVTIARG